MDVAIRNCNSIDNANITIHENGLNIKYGINGTGKSSLVKAIQYGIQDPKLLSTLMPFKYRNTETIGENAPAVSNLDNFKSIAVFNDEYINRYVFQKDEVVNNSFEIFIKTPEYEEKMEAIDKLILDIKETFKNNEHLDIVIKDLTELSESFGKPTKTGISAAAAVNKAIGKGNKVQNIPTELSLYTPFLRLPNNENVKWLKWQLDGQAYLDASTDCPYCTSPTNDKRETILTLGKIYDSKSVEHLNKLLTTLNQLGEYFSDETKIMMQQIIANNEGISAEQQNFLIGIKDQVDVLRNKLVNLQNISFYSFKDSDVASEKINSLKIDINFLDRLNSASTVSIVNSVNTALESVLKNIGVLQGQINMQKLEIQKTIKKHKTDINDFLKYAGYSYHVDIEEENQSYKMRLKHKDFNTKIENSNVHLSYGERNAFSLVLFMYESLSKNYDLIVLDDPISSFDKNKKYAIVEMLFRRPNSFMGKTVLMMTHDFEPVIDIVRTLNRYFHPAPQAYFLKNENGTLTETKIEKMDIVSFYQVCQENVALSSHDIIKAIYLRRFHEVMNDKGHIYNLLSSLLHKREVPTAYNGEVTVIMSAEDIQKASEKIKDHFTNFDYQNILTQIKDNAAMLILYESASCNYEKLQIYRLIKEGTGHHNNIIQKFINETFHVENEFVVQLNPIKFDPIPSYIIEECSLSLGLSQKMAA